MILVTFMILLLNIIVSLKINFVEGFSDNFSPVLVIKYLIFKKAVYDKIITF